MCAVDSVATHQIGVIAVIAGKEYHPLKLQLQQYFQKDSIDMDLLHPLPTSFTESTSSNIQLMKSTACKKKALADRNVKIAR